MSALCHAVDSDTNHPLTFSVGPAVQIMPAFPGASASRAFPVPDIEAGYDHFYISGNDLIGYRAVDTATTRAGVAVDYDFTERRATDCPAARRLSDVPSTPRFKVFMEHNLLLVIMPALDVATDAGGHHEGTIAHAHVDLQLPLTARGFFTIGPGVTWSDRRWMSAFYGVSVAQSIVANLARYDARAGVSDAYVESVAGYRLSSRWAVGIDVLTTRLQGDAQRSPFTESHWQTTTLASLIYKIR